jgi:hypothetical protein
MGGVLSPMYCGHTGVSTVSTIDIMMDGYWVDGDELEMVMGAPLDKEYDAFATFSIVGENVQFTLAVRPRQNGER